MNLNKKIKNKIKKHAQGELPRECCGLIIENEGGLDSYPCNNRATDKKNFFEIDTRDYLKASKKGGVVAYYHSHTEHIPEFSSFDKFISDIHALPMILYSVNHDEFKEYFPE